MLAPPIQPHPDPARPTPTPPPPPPPPPTPNAAGEVAKLDTQVAWARALDGSEYMPGLVGLNNMKKNDYANVVIQALTRVHPIRWAGSGGRGGRWAGHAWFARWVWGGGHPEVRCGWLLGAAGRRGRFGARGVGGSCWQGDGGCACKFLEELESMLSRA